MLSTMRSKATPLLGVVHLVLRPHLALPHLQATLLRRRLHRLRDRLGLSDRLMERKVGIYSVYDPMYCSTVVGGNENGPEIP